MSVFSSRRGLVISPRDDVHAHAVVFAAKRIGATVQVVDAQEFTRSFDMRTRIGAHESSLTLSSADMSVSIEGDAISGVWYRRPYGYTDNAFDSTYNSGIEVLAQLERRVALFGSLHGFADNAFNDLSLSRQANNKPSQLMRAQKIGLTVPETLITNDPIAVRGFVDSIDGRVVYKMFGSPPLGVYGTRPLQKEDMARLDRLVGCPAIFQEFIEGDFDVRATVVGDKVFAARLVFDQSRDYFDTRFVNTEISPHVLPNDIERKLVELVKSFGLVYSAIDLRHSASRGYVFFESNPEGQYLWTEIEANLHISHEIATKLTGRQ